MGREAETKSPSWWSNPFCHPRTDSLHPAATPRQQSRSGQLIGALVAASPLIALAIWMYGIRDVAPTMRFMLGGPLVCGSILIVWILWVNRAIGGDRFSSLGLRTDRWWVEGMFGVAGGLVLLALHMVTSPILRSMFPAQPPPPEILELIGGLSRRPLLLALWFGPVVWIGIALFEELWRVHLLRRLWRLWPGPSGRWVVILVAAAIVAGLHIYQPPAVMVSIFVLSVLKGAYFMATGRFWSLVIAHAVYDSVQIAMAIVSIRGLG